MKIKITNEIINIINNLGNKTIINSGYKIYAMLYSLDKRKNPNGFFDVPSSLLRSIHSRYAKIRDIFIENGIITYKQSRKIDPKDLFNWVPSKTYSSHMGYCMKYKFLVDLSKGEEIEVDMKTGRKKRWYEITANTLTELGYDSKITRDSFGRRVHYPLISDYKVELVGKGLCIIDSVTSQPRLLWLMMKNRNIIDPAYNQIFINELDLYNYLASTLNLKDREAGRDVFSHWINGNGFIPDFRINHLFPIATNFILGLKKMHYKDSASYLQRAEAKIWIDDLLENIPTEFALPVHDSLIIREVDFEMVLEYCNRKYPDLRFKRNDF